MPSLGDAYEGASDESNRRRLYVGAALLFIGAAVAAPWLAGALSAVGVAEGTALTLSVVAAGLAVPLVGAALLRYQPVNRPARTAGAAGVLLAAVAVAGFVATAPGESGLAGVPLIVLVTYAAGALLALGAPVAAAGLAAEAAPRRTSRPDTAFVRQRRTVQPRSRVPADGGSEDQELAFLLDNDDK